MRLVLALLAALLAIGAGEPPFEINAVLSLTGGLAFLGTDERDALQLIAENVNASGGIRGRQIAFNVADDQSNTQVSVQLVQGLISKGVGVILGPVISSPCRAVLPLVVERGPVTFCLSPGVAGPPKSFMFSSGTTNNDTFFPAMRYFRGRGWLRIAFITATDASGQVSEEALNATIAQSENLRVQIVDREHFNNGDISIAAQMSRIAAQHPQAIWAAVNGASFGAVLRAMRDAGLNVPVWTNYSNMTYDLMAQYAAFLPQDVLFSAPLGMIPGTATSGAVRDAQQVLAASLKRRNVRETAGHNAIWDAAMLTVDAYRKLGFGATAQQIHDYLESLHAWTGINGVYDYRDGSQRGIGQRAIVVYHWDAARGDFTAVSRPAGDVN